MRDEFDDIRELIRSERPIVPREEARRSAIFAALARFDGDRLSHRLWGLLKRSEKMSSMKLSHVLMAGTSLAVLTFAVVNTGALYQTFRSDIGKPHTVVPVTKPAKNEAPIAKLDGEAPVVELEKKMRERALPQSEESLPVPLQAPSKLSSDALAPPLAG